jgi:outer membrane protein assembly factor BamD (BamD/ComL family)
MAELALDALMQVINRFLGSSYARDTRLNRYYVYAHLAGKQMSIGQ